MGKKPFILFLSIALLAVGILSAKNSKQTRVLEETTYYELAERPGECFPCSLAEEDFRDLNCVDTPTIHGRCECTVPDNAAPNTGTPGAIVEGTANPNDCQQLWKNAS